MPAAFQDGVKQVLVRAKVFEGALADLGAKVLKPLIDRLEGQVEGKLPHPLHQRFGPLEGMCLAGHAVMDCQAHCLFSLSGCLSVLE